MRPESEIKDRATLGKKILVFAQGFRSLLVPSAPVLADAVLILHSLVLLSDKVLPLKTMLELTQDIQRTSYLAQRLATLMASQADPSLGKTYEHFALELRNKNARFLTDKLVELLQIEEHQYVQEAGKAPGQYRKHFEQRIAQESQAYLATEDVFMVACSFLEVEIAKQGSVYYLKGESPEFKETKKHRNPLKLTDEVVLKTLSGSLARPDAERGKIERGLINHGFNHLVRLNSLNLMMPDVIQWINDAEAAGKPQRKIDIRSKFDLSHTEYERLMSMARRAGLISFRNRKKDPSNAYTLRIKNQERVVEYAARFGFSPQKTLNNIVSDFFKLLEKQQRKEGAGN